MPRRLLPLLGGYNSIWWNIGTGVCLGEHTSITAKLHLKSAAFLPRICFALSFPLSVSPVLLNLVAGHRLAAACEHFWELCRRNKALPRFLAMFSPNRWNVKCPVYAKKGFYRLTSGGLTAAKCAMSARSRLNGPWMVACLGSCSCYGGRVRKHFLFPEWSLSDPKILSGPMCLDGTV